MLFYERLFLFNFFPVLFVGFLGVRRSDGVRACLLLAASLVFF